MNKKIITAVATTLALSAFAFSRGATPHAEDGHDRDHDHAAEKSPATVPAAASHDEHEGHDHGSAGADPHKHEDDHKPGDAHAHAEQGHSGHDHAKGGHADEVRLTPEAIRRGNVQVGTVTKQALGASFSAPARVVFNAEAMAHVGSLVSGRAVEIKVKVGDAVKVGDELIVVESPELGEAQSDYLQKKTVVAVATAAVEPAKKSTERAAQLFEKNQGIALAEVQKREAEFAAAQGALQTAQAALDAAQNKLHLMGLDAKAIEHLATTREINPRYIVRTPIEGRVIERETTLGELVSPDKDALVVIADVRRPWIIADVPERKVRDVYVGATVQVRTALNSTPIPGAVTYIAPALDPNTRTAQVRIERSGRGRALMPGMFAQVEIFTESDEEAETLVVPEQAIQTVEGRPAVFIPVKDEPNTFAARPVKVGRASGGMTPIESGLDEGDSVVVSGSFLLKADLGKSGAAHSH